MKNLERMKKPTRSYNELHGERLEKERQLSKRRQQGSQCNQWQQVDVNAIQL
jgi:hypothetical protein